MIARPGPLRGGEFRNEVGADAVCEPHPVVPAVEPRTFVVGALSVDRENHRVRGLASTHFASSLPIHRKMDILAFNGPETVY